MKGEPRGFADSFIRGCKRKKGGKNDAKVLPTATGRTELPLT